MPGPAFQGDLFCPLQGLRGQLGLPHLQVGNIEGANKNRTLQVLPPQDSPSEKLPGGWKIVVDLSPQPHTHLKIISGLRVVRRDGLVVVLPYVRRFEHLLGLELLVLSHDGLGVHQTGNAHAAVVQLQV